ncbi:MAG: hypothetical protein NUV50_10220 [Rhodospirillales bacterium]|nr:hypothetical protein [Rhodospirillales bacterium]
MKFVQRGFWLFGICTSLTYANPANAGWACDWFGIGCETVTVPGKPGAVKLSAEIDQNNPPEVFAFTISGTFDEWTAIPEETFICDTRKREDRACVWQGYIEEIKRSPTLIFKPFAHDLGMYGVDGFIANAFGKDPEYRSHVGVAMVEQVEGKPFAYLAYFKQISITHLAQYPLQMDVFKGGYRSLEKDRDVPVGKITATFKGVLK